MDPDAGRRARVLVLSGPSGAGKSRLARRLHESHGWPLLPLDDFYREVEAPGLPMSPLGLPDWDDVRSWDLDAALTAAEELCVRGSTRVPTYDIATSRVVGHRTLELGEASVVVAEGIFAAHTVEGLRERGLLAGAWCVHHRPWVVFARRLARDLAERRKPPLTLWRRGHALRRAQPGIVAAHRALGAEPVRARVAERLAGDLLEPRRHGIPRDARDAGGAGG